jgi:hypothetical protein
MAKITGHLKASARLHATGSKEAIEDVGRALFVGADIIKAEAQHLITEGSVSGKNHVPSLPGEPPNNDTGVLKSHIEATQTAPLRAQVTSSAKYAVPLEFGSSRGLEERPYMRPATRNKREEVIAGVKAALQKHIRRK